MLQLAPFVTRCLVRLLAHVTDEQEQKELLQMLSDLLLTHPSEATASNAVLVLEALLVQPLKPNNQVGVCPSDIMLVTHVLSCLVHTTNAMLIVSAMLATLPQHLPQPPVALQLEAVAEGITGIAQASTYFALAQRWVACMHSFCKVQACCVALRDCCECSSCEALSVWVVASVVASVVVSVVASVVASVAARSLLEHKEVLHYCPKDVIMADRPPPWPCSKRKMQMSAGCCKSLLCRLHAWRHNSSGSHGCLWARTAWTGKASYRLCIARVLAFC